MKFKKTYFTIGALASFLVGIFLANFIKIDIWWLVGILAGVIIGLVLFYADILWRFILIIFIALIVGLGYYQIWDNHENAKMLAYGQQLTANGMVSEKPVLDGAAQKITINYSRTKILVTTARYPEYKYGDIVNITGTIKDPHDIKTIDNFNYGRYLLHKGIRGTIQNPEKIVVIGNKGNFLIKFIFKIGDKFQDALNKVLPEPYAAFQNGLLTGSKINIPDSLMSAFNRTGTTHIVAVSGYNVTIIISVLAILFAIFGRRFSFWLSVIFVLAFVILTGGTASVVRAGILAIMVAWGRLLGRRVNYTILILFVASAMILFNPYALLDDVSFQLSFMAFAGMIYLSPIVGELKIISFLPKTIKQIFSETMSAQIMVLPILIYSFGTLSLVAPIVNILILPLVPSAMLLGFLAGIGQLISVNIGQILGDLAWVLLKYMIEVVQYFSNIPWAAVGLTTGEWWWIVPYYAIVITWIYNNNKSKIKNPNFQSNPNV